MARQGGLGRGLAALLPTEAEPHPAEHLFAPIAGSEPMSDLGTEMVGELATSQSGLAIAIDLASIAAIFVDRMSTRCSGEAALQNKSSLVPMLVVAVAVALIAGVTGWTIRSHADAKAAAGATENAAEGDMAAQIPTNPSQANNGVLRDW